MNQLYVYVYLLLLEPPSHPAPPHRSRSSQSMGLGCPAPYVKLLPVHSLTMVTCMFQCYSLASSHPRLLPQRPTVCSLSPCLLCCQAAVFNAASSLTWAWWLHRRQTEDTPLLSPSTTGHPRARRASGPFPASDGAQQEFTGGPLGRSRGRIPQLDGEAKTSSSPPGGLVWPDWHLLCLPVKKLHTRKQTSGNLVLRVFRV